MQVGNGVSCSLVWVYDDDLYIWVLLFGCFDFLKKNRMVLGEVGFDQYKKIIGFQIFICFWYCIGIKGVLVVCNGGGYIEVGIGINVG